MTRTYGWKPDLPDKRDRYHVPRDMAAALPRKVDLSSMMPAPWDQGALGACTAFAIGAAFAYERFPSGEFFEPSFLQLYYAERELEGTVPIDAGAYLRTGMKVAAQQGIAHDDAWGYEPSMFAHRPPKTVRKSALDNRVSSYARVRQTSGDIRSTIAGGDTIVCGVSVYESFEDAGTWPRRGDVQMPGTNEDLLGGHAILLVGYDDDAELFKFRNSWGTRWGDDGHGYLPYEYVLDEDLAADFWVLKAVTP